MANNIVMVDFPIVYTGGKFYNTFRAFVEESIQLRMQMESSCTVNDNGGFIRLNGFTDYAIDSDDEGEEIVIVGGGYQPAKGLITGSDEGPDLLDTDIPYVAGATVRFFIKYPNLRMRYRFCEYTSLDDQSAINLFGDSEFLFYPDEFGDLYIDISIIKHLLKPSFTADNDYNDDMVKTFQVQYKTEFDGNTDTWHSAHDTGLPSFEAFVSAHATERNALIDIWNNKLEASLDTDLDGRIWRGYDKIFSTLTPEVETPNSIRIQVIEYNIAKASITTQTLFAVGSVEDGLLVTKITSLNAATRFCVFTFTTNIGVSPINHTYNLTVYDTNQDENEFYITWISDNGTIRQWLFTNKILFDNDLTFDALNGTDFRPVPSELEEVITVEAKGISAIEREYISSLFVSNKIQVENDGNTIECVVDDPSWSYENRSNSYIVTIGLRLKNKAIMNV